ncbi:hypothetical protein [Novosphingobium sp. 9U]|uniref:hypothetical protein n=1 Tax=Novosphingobium sp. 9U TaxID=2653158 RepID=UPI001356FC25|nr:hypothetical protein [Novosphingobium sp. 9U]
MPLPRPVNRANKRGEGGNRAMPTLEITIDVSDAARLGVAAHIAATVTLPEHAPVDHPIVCFARPSSSYTRAYYTHDLPGAGAGAQAAFHAARGWIFVALDTLGCDRSPEAEALDRERLDFATLAAAAHAAEQDILARLANGVLLAGYPPVIQPTVLGLGLALGGALAIYQQARHRSYHRLGVLGFSAVHTHPLAPPGGELVTVGWYPRDAGLETGWGEGAEPLNAEALAAAERSGRGGAAWAALAWGFHYDDVPREVVERDLRHYDAIAGGTAEHGDDGPWYARRTPERAARSTLTPGVVATEAAAITVPVLAAMGERDLVPDPAGEARAYRSASSMDLFVCPRMGHVHNMAGTRALLWERLDLFGQWCAAVRAAS